MRSDRRWGSVVGTVVGCGSVAVGFAVLPWSAADYNFLAKSSLVIATALTLYSGLQYAAVAIKARKLV